MSDKPSEKAAGGLVYRDVDGAREVLVAHRPRYDDWTFPKGKLDEGESLIECALREVREETGLECEVGRYLGTTRFDSGRGQLKEVSYWAMHPVGSVFEPNDEVDEIAWLSQQELADHLTYPIDASFEAELDESWTNRPDRILLNRHAHAGDRFRWIGNDTERPLSAQGYAEADGIAQQLAGFGIDRILSSRATRCKETIAPTAEVRDLSVEVHDDLWEGTSYGKVVDLVELARLGTTVLCSHGPIVAIALHALTGVAGGLPMEKACTWVLDFEKGSLVAANYIAPPDVKSPRRNNRVE